jgi:hypothetical protein
VGVLLSIYWLGEPLIPKYDVPAFLFMMGGGVSLVCMGNKTISFFKTEELKAIMKSRAACVYYTVLTVSAFTAILAYWFMMR